MPTDEQAVAEHAADKESIDYRRVALLVLRRTVQAYVENHPYLQLGGYDGRCLERLHEGRRVADAGHRAIVNLAVDEIGKRDDGALLEFRYAIGFKKRVKVRFDLVKAGYIGVEDVPVGRVYRKRNAEYPTVRARSRKGIGMLQDRPIPLFLDDWRAAADDGRIGGDERNIDVPVGKEFPGKSPRIEDQVVAFRRLILEFHFRAAVHPRDIEHFCVDMARLRAFLKQFPHQVGGQVVGVGYLLRREVVGEVLVAPPPPLECNAVLARSLQALLDGFVRQTRQLLQLLNQGRPTAFAHPYDRDAGVVDMVQFMIRVRVKMSHGSGRQRPCGSPANHCDFL